MQDANMPPLRWLNGLLPPPWVVLSIVFAAGTYVQDAADILALIPRVIIGRKGSGCHLCHKMLDVVLKVSELDEAENIDCGKLCFGRSQCAESCAKLISAMDSSKDYPCIAAGLCPEVSEDLEVECHFSWRQLRCTPTDWCARKFPARCQIVGGLKTWRRYTHHLQKHAGLLANALAQRPRCGTPGAGPYCVSEAIGLGRVCEVASWVVPFLFGTASSIRAVESPGGDDDRQWLTFWVCFFVFLAVRTRPAAHPHLLPPPPGEVPSPDPPPAHGAVTRPQVERGTSVLLSWLPRYYEVKLLLLCWLMFRRGADSV